MRLLALTTQKATLIAAVIAAVATVLKLVVDFVSARGSEARAAHRQVLSPHLVEIGTAIHSVVSGAVLVHERAKRGQKPGEADTQAGQSGAELLKRKRLEVKYPLSGTNEALRTLSRAYDWAAAFRGDTSGDAFIEAVRKLSKVVDETIARSYSRGRPPKWWERRNRPGGCETPGPDGSDGAQSPRRSSERIGPSVCAAEPVTARWWCRIDAHIAGSRSRARS
jgi:hypothetical protein